MRSGSRSTRRRDCLAAFALLSAAVACNDNRAPTLPEADDRLARTYIRALHDSGAVAVMGRTKRESAAVPAFAFGIDAMRALLPRGPIDTVQLERWETVRDSAHSAGATHLTYVVRGAAEAAQVDVWVEREVDRPVVEEFRVARRSR
jgi:hypothetical protein